MLGTAEEARAFTTVNAVEIRFFRKLRNVILYIRVKNTVISERYSLKMNVVTKIEKLMWRWFGNRVE